MNYDNFNDVFNYYNKNIFPYVSHNFPAISFDDYIRRFSYLSCGKWIRDMETLKISRVVIGIDPKKLAKKFRHKCVTYNFTTKPEEGYQRIIYQYSPTLHFEMTIWIWPEHNKINSYGFLIVCYNDIVEYKKFIKTIWKMRLTGNTDEKPIPTGFNMPMGTGFKV